MKKLFYRLIILALLGMLFAPFILKRENGKPILTPEEFMSFDTALITYRYKTALRKIRAYIASDNEDGSFFDGSYQPDSETTQYYRWQDEEGVWHFSDTPPSTGKQLEKLEVNNNQNVLNFEDIDKDGQSKDASKKKTTEPKSGFVRGIQDKLNKAEEVQDIIDKDFEEKSRSIDSR